MKVVIIEDEYPSAMRLQKMLAQVSQPLQVMMILDSVAEAVEYLNSGVGVDLLFLDIQLTDGLGLEILEQIDRPIPTVFTTAFEEYALAAFQYLSVDYLLKPIKKVALERSLQKYQTNFQTNTVSIHELRHLLHPTQNIKTLLGQIGKNYYPIAVEDIAYCYVAERETWLTNHAGKEYVLPQTLEQLEQQLNPQQFFRANRRLICSKNSVGKFKMLHKSKISLQLVPKPDFEVQISFEKSAAFKQWLVS
ncbi:MAG: LytR/AlgR family response regulator transcription factor [Saprospiraceae bacterium]